MLFLNRRDPTRLIVAKNSTPIVIGWGEGETFIASDIPALLDYTRKVTFLEDGEIGEVRLGSYRLLDGKGKTIHRPVKEITWDAVAARKGGYPHFMLKEIHDQPRALADTFRGRISLKDGQVALEDIKFKASEAKRSNAFTWLPAALPGMPVWWANSCSKKSPAFPRKSTMVRSFATARR